MNYYGAKELASSFRTVRKNTIQTAEDIPEDQVRIHPGRRHEEHRANTRPYRPVPAASDDDPMRRSLETASRVSISRHSYNGSRKRRPRTERRPRCSSFCRPRASDGRVSWEGVTEDFLAEPFGMPPGATPASKSRFEMLLSAKEHEMHHRGQLAVAQRLLGIVPHLTRLREEHVAAAKTAATVS